MRLSAFSIRRRSSHPRERGSTLQDDGRLPAYATPPLPGRSCDGLPSPRRGQRSIGEVSIRGPSSIPCGAVALFDEGLREPGVRRGGRSR